MIATLLLATLTLTASRQAAAPATVSPEAVSQLDQQTVSQYCTIKYTAGKEQDASQLANDVDWSLELMAHELAPLDPHLMDDFSCTIFQFAKPQKGVADDATADSQTDGRGQTMQLYLLAASSISRKSRTVVGEPKDQDYAFGLISSELSTALFERVTRDKSRGWYFQDAPQWFVQGIEGYFGLIYSSPHERDVTLPKYVAVARTHPDEIQFDHGIQARDPYVSGVALVAFLYDAYGADCVDSLLTSSKPTFGEAFSAVFGDAQSVAAKYRAWTAVKVHAAAK
jgi:hypothetical protein